MHDCSLQDIGGEDSNICKQEVDNEDTKVGNRSHLGDAKRCKEMCCNHGTEEDLVEIQREWQKTGIIERAEGCCSW